MLYVCYDSHDGCPGRLRVSVARPDPFADGVLAGEEAPDEAFANYHDLGSGLVILLCEVAASLEGYFHGLEIIVVRKPVIGQRGIALVGRRRPAFDRELIDFLCPA